MPKSSYLLIDEIFKTPVVSIAELSRKWGIPFNSIKTGVNRLVDLGILKQQPGRKRNKLFTAPGILKLLKEEK